MLASGRLACHPRSGPAEPNVIVAHKGGVFGVSGSRVNSVIATVGIRAAANQQVGVLGIHGLRDAMAKTNKMVVSRVCLPYRISVYGSHGRYKLSTVLPRKLVSSIAHLLAVILIRREPLTVSGDRRSFG
jgi:hypothetical protein